ncbi:MAG: glycoside hydrolase [Acidobacteriota bacterium]|nr:glycoside hydrolase [Acidobacteriota bacterium]
MRRRIVAATILLVVTVPARSQEKEKPLIQDYARAVISAPPDSLAVDPFYKKYTDALGISVVGSEKVPDAALLVARDIVIHMLAKRPDLRDEMLKKRMRVGVMAQSESTTDIPEQKNWKKPSRNDPRLTPGERNNYDNGIAKMTDKDYWDRRARGMGGNPTTCAEENLLGYPGTRYYGENIFVHEFSHAIMGVAIRTVDPTLFADVQAAYKEAIAKGLW